MSELEPHRGKWRLVLIGALRVALATVAVYALWLYLTKRDVDREYVALVILGFVYEVVRARRAPSKPRLALREELESLFRFGTPAVEDVLLVLEKAGDQPWFERERELTEGVFHHALPRDEWERAMRRRLRIG